MEQYEGKKNAELALICEEKGLKVLAKNVSKPTRAELIKVLSDDLQDGNDFLASGEPEVLEVAVIPEIAKAAVSKSKAKNEADAAKALYDEKHRMIRCVITQNSDNQTKIQHKTFSWGNRVLGHQTDRVVFGKPWHVRRGALDNIENAIYVKSVNNEDFNRVDSVPVPAYNVQILTPLTQKEIDVIARKQELRNASVDSLV